MIFDWIKTTPAWSKLTPSVAQKHMLQVIGKNLDKLTTVELSHYHNARATYGVMGYLYDRQMESVRIIYEIVTEEEERKGGGGKT